MFSFTGDKKENEEIKHAGRITLREASLQTTG
jgi:hypothetical protein